MKKIFALLILCAVLAALGLFLWKVNESKILKGVISRLENFSRRAEVLVVQSSYDKGRDCRVTGIKFVEYDRYGKPLAPKYFTFFGDIIQFQALVIRFQDRYVESGDAFRGKSVCLFWKVFALNGALTQEYPLQDITAVPQGFRSAYSGIFEDFIWRRFWKYALDPLRSAGMGIKSLQIEAPGTRFVPGMLYVLNIEHNGGIRIDPVPLPGILKGERIPG